jgi:redox-sensitive bicupin YhaK (pirin superfamily)
LEKKSPVPVYSQLFYCNGTGEKNKDFEMEVEKQHEAAVYVIKGKIEIEGKTYHPYDLICFKPGHPIKFKIIEDAHFMLFGGEVFPEGRIMWWNFVSTSQEKIDLAKKRWREGGYPKVINENEKISLPED